MACSQTTIKPVQGLVFTVNAEVTVKEQDADAWVAAFKTAREHVLEEPECLFFNLGRKLNVDPITQGPGDIPEGEVAFIWSEGFSESPEWLRDVQMKKEYYGPYFAKAIPLETSRKANIVFPEEGACAFKA